MERLGKIAESNKNNNKQYRSPIQQVLPKKGKDCHSRDYKVQSTVNPYHHDQRSKISRAPHIYVNCARLCKTWCMLPNEGNIKLKPSSRPSSVCDEKAENRKLVQ